MRTTGLFLARDGWARRVVVVALVWGLTQAAGCLRPRQARDGGQQWAPADARSGSETVFLGTSIQGRAIECQVLGPLDVDSDEVVMIMATIHGDELAGKPLVDHLCEYLVEHPEEYANRRIVLMPVANPDGLAIQTRGNRRGVDLNRNFPAANWTQTDAHGPRALSEPESRAIYIALHRYRPDRIVTIHQPLECIDYDGPAKDLAIAMEPGSDLPVKRLGSRPGSLGSYAGVMLGIPIVTLELPESASDLDAGTLWDRYGQTLLAAIRFPAGA